MTRRTVVLSGALVIALALGGVGWYLKPWERGPASASASTGGGGQPSNSPWSARVGATTPIYLQVQVFEAPFGAEKNDEIVAVIGKGEDGTVRIVRAAEVTALRDAMNMLTETGQATLLSTSRTAVRPGQRVTVRVANRPAHDPSGARARDDLTLVVMAAWSDGGAMSVDGAFQFERVINDLALLQDGRGPRAGAVPNVSAHDELVFSQVLAGIRFIVLVRADKQPSR